MVLYGADKYESGARVVSVDRASAVRVPSDYQHQLLAVSPLHCAMLHWTAHPRMA